MRHLKRNLYIGMVLSIFMIMAMQDVDATPSVIPDPEPTVVSLQAQIDSAKAAQLMNALTGICIRESMRRGLSPDSMCIMYEP